ncbi:precorrin-6y C5,15-methyltransferase (decarboxylating) subunit CbiE [Lyngbya confervoides]|uniref:tRNA (guanine(46)-N(7))-methyltransferase n=1 Tax=Lyngbya confervoides BDU141951 TaxID=1574623 RepID=A0ABD4T705_9CYAN|nr:precorrin-6y C5,15-methyltransferase (decarboxylating) subunit CbiE [Lyngbya confervoides]MCM1984251.1 precorrin-6y C5,15-methyltransferase (decarboxylating) subunit CbiE [Lyngbya confervoides BDU141951]
MTLIHVVGLGLAGREDLSPRLQVLIQQADLLIGSKRHLANFPDVAAEQWCFGDLSEVLSRLKTYLQLHSTRTAVILTTGDPLFFGLGRLLLSFFSADQLSFYPALTSVQLAFSRLKIPWQDACFVSVHGRSFEELANAIQQGRQKIAILTDPVHSPSAVAAFIASLETPVCYQGWVCENLGSAEEIVRPLEISPGLTGAYAALSVVILLRQGEAVSGENLPLLGIPDHQFLSFADRPGLMTKREVRLLAVGELELQAQQIFWDIGAGTGSLSVEVARTLGSGQVYAIEKSAAGAMLIRQNARRFGIENLHCIQGPAPEVLRNLPKPDRVFIGGSGQALTEILRCVADRLSHDGRMVLAIATLEHLSQASQWCRQNQWPVRILQVQLSRSVPVAHLTRFQPLNPVYLLQARPPDFPYSSAPT